MTIKTTKIFDKEYRNVPDRIKKQANKQFAFLLEDSHHPSLRVKKVKSKKGIWEARITKNYRFTFQLTENIYLLRRIGKHDEVLKNP